MAPNRVSQTSQKRVLCSTTVCHGFIKRWEQLGVFRNFQSSLKEYLCLINLNNRNFRLVFWVFFTLNFPIINFLCFIKVCVCMLKVFWHLYCFGGGCSGTVSGADPLPLHHHGLLAVEIGSAPVGGSHAQIQAVLTLAASVLDATGVAQTLFFDVHLLIGGGWLSQAGSLLHDDHHTPLPAPRPLSWSELTRCSGRSCGPSKLGFGALRLRVPLHQEAEAVLYNHLLQVGSHAVVVRQPETEGKRPILVAKTK